MKRTPLILSILAVLIAACALILSITGRKPAHKPAAADGSEITAVAGDIVYIQLDSLILNYDMYSDLSSELESKKQSIEEDINRRGRKLESDMKAFENQINKGLLTRSAAEKQQQSLLQRQQDLQNTAQIKQGEILEENEVMMNRVMDAVKTYLEEYNDAHNFAAILTTSATTNTVMIGNPALDITREILEGLNAEYVKSRNKSSKNDE